MLLAALAFLALAPPAWAGAGRADFARAVWSNQFSFDPAGAPVVRVGLAGGLLEATFRASGPIVFQPQGEGGSFVRLEGGQSWRVRVGGGAPALVRTWVVVERVEPPDAAPVAAALALWRSRGFPDARAFDRGALFGFSGEVMDTRYALVAVAGEADPGAAREVAATIERSYGLRPSLQEALDRMPDGVVEVSGAAGGPSLGANRALRVAPGRDDVRFALERVDRAAALAPGETDPSGRTYRGALYFAVDRSGLLAVGNEIGAEALLEGLVPAELYPAAPDEALRVQAVTARNEVLAKVGTRHLAEPYLLCDDVHCQVYPGAGKETPRATAAVARTRGEMLFSGGRLVDAVYSASCGGSAEANDAAWSVPPDPALRHRLDVRGAAVSEGLGTDAGLRRFLTVPPEGAWCRLATLGAHSFRWERRLAQAELTGLVSAGYTVGPVRDLRVTARGPGGRAVELEVTGDAGRASVRGELAIRRLLGGLKSALFVLEPERDARGHLRGVRVVGGGFGHGVGMCQIGAIGRAEAGHGYREILRAYYAGAEIKRIY